MPLPFKFVSTREEELQILGSYSQRRSFDIISATDILKNLLYLGSQVFIIVVRLQHDIILPHERRVGWYYREF